MSKVFNPGAKARERASQANAAAQAQALKAAEESRRQQEELLEDRRNQTAVALPTENDPQHKAAKRRERSKNAKRYGRESTLLTGRRGDDRRADTRSTLG